MTDLERKALGAIAMIVSGLNVDKLPPDAGTFELVRLIVQAIFALGVLVIGIILIFTRGKEA